MDKIELYYNGVDIYDKVSLNFCVHEMNAEHYADSLTLRFNDSAGVWSKYGSEANDIIRLKYGDADSGAMYLHSMSAQNGLFTIRALSMPAEKKEKKSRNWKGMKLTSIVAQLAEEHGLKYALYGVEEQVYRNLTQTDETDFEFLERLCSYESCCFLIHNKKLVVYSEPYMEAREASTLEVGQNGQFDYGMIKKKYTSCKVISGSYTGTFSIGNTGELLVRRDVQASSEGEAIRYAKGLLRKENKKTIFGRIIKSLQTQYSAASVVKLHTDRASLWDKKMFITCIRNDYIKNRSDIYFRGIPEGY